MHHATMRVLSGVQSIVATYEDNENDKKRMSNSRSETHTERTSEMMSNCHINTVCNTRN